MNDVSCNLTSVELNDIKEITEVERPDSFNWTEIILSYFFFKMHPKNIMSLLIG